MGKRSELNLTQPMEAVLALPPLTLATTNKSHHALRQREFPRTVYIPHPSLSAGTYYPSDTLPPGLALQLPSVR